jgi:hydrogenase maturation protein HypF
VYGLALRLELSGWVRNDSSGIEIELEGDGLLLEAFLQELRDSSPPMARLEAIDTTMLEPFGTVGFEIRSSRSHETAEVHPAPDLATCPECLKELLEPSDRRYRYPFLNCTNCGPRYTILLDLPYDRSRTTMRSFEMCEPCRHEYENPADRRFHAEPTCCPRCGPSVWLTDGSGGIVESPDCIGACIDFLRQGRIIAIKGLGGFHLACDASHDDAVRGIRRRKVRHEKPFAVMVRDLEAARELAFVSDEEERFLVGRERPVVLLRKRPDTSVSEWVAPKSGHLGIMLPYTPLHHLLLNGFGSALVMTSGNRAGGPIVHKNEEALERLSGVADGFLLHDREIHVRTDDSVVRVAARGQRFLRRSRGYAPLPIGIPSGRDASGILAVGPELKNTICISRGRHAFLSHHIGDLRSGPAYAAFVQAVKHLAGLLEVEPKTVACDLHPNYLSTQYACELGLPVVRVQHHHAHIASVLAEHQRTDRVIGVAFDGLGWGEGGEAWGGEFLVCDLAGYDRVGHLGRVPLPGGDAAARRPERMAYVYLRSAFGSEAERLCREWMPGFPERDRKTIATMIDRDLNTPRTSSAGRLFDAVSALLGVCRENTYEGQAPMELETVALKARGGVEAYPVEVHGDEEGQSVVCFEAMIRALVADMQAGRSKEICAARFHHSVARCIVDVCRATKRETGIRTVALSGGVFANALLLELVCPLLRRAGFEVLTHSLVPPGDGGVSLGQAAVAAWSRAGP